MFSIMMSPTVKLCYMTSCPSVARKARKHIEEHLQDLAMYTSKWAIIEVPDFVKPNKVNNPHNKDILHFVFDGVGHSVQGELGKNCKALAERKGSWLNCALTSNTLFMGNDNAAGLYLVYADFPDDENFPDNVVLRAVPIERVAEMVYNKAVDLDIM